MVADPDDILTINLSEDTMVDDERVVDSIIIFDKELSQHFFHLRSRYIRTNRTGSAKWRDKVHSYFGITQSISIEINEN